MRRALVAFALILLGAFLSESPASALGLKIAPLEYRTTLSSKEFKKGIVDISNPENVPVIVRTSVQGFRQTDDQGTLQFYDDEQLSEGIKLDLNEFELGPREALRMYFQLDSSKLPSGDVFAGIFFTTNSTEVTRGTGQSVKLGTLLSIVNGAPGERKADITNLTVNSFVLSDTISGKYSVKNTGDPSKSSGFYPNVKLGLFPFGDSKTKASSLVFAGRERTNEFSLRSPFIGIFKVQASNGQSSQSKWIVVIRPVALFTLVALFIAALTVVIIRRKSTRNH